jgi:hypothetical protein
MKGKRIRYSHRSLGDVYKLETYDGVEKALVILADHADQCELYARRLPHPTWAAGCGGVPSDKMVKVLEVVHTGDLVRPITNKERSKAVRSILREMR